MTTEIAINSMPGTVAQKQPDTQKGAPPWVNKLKKVGFHTAGIAFLVVATAVTKAQSQDQLSFSLGNSPRHRLDDGNLDFSQIANIKYVIDPETNLGKWVNNGKEGDPGYVHGIVDGKLNLSLDQPEVDGFSFVKRTDTGEPGVEFIEYREVSPTPGK
jgi:hypothetical protein